MRRGALVKLVNQRELMGGAASVVVLALLALFGSSIAAKILPLLIVAEVGFVLGYIAITDDFPAWLQRTAGFLAVAAVVGWGLALASVLLGAGWADRIQLWEPGSPTSYAGAFGFGLLIALRNKLLFPFLFPDDPEEAKRQGSNARQNVLIVGGLFLALVVLILVIYAIFTLIVQGVVFFLE